MWTFIGSTVKCVVKNQRITHPSIQQLEQSVQSTELISLIVQPLLSDSGEKTFQINVTYIKSVYLQIQKQIQAALGLRLCLFYSHLTWCLKHKLFKDLDMQAWPTSLIRLINSASFGGFFLSFFFGWVWIFLSHHILLCVRLESWHKTLQFWVLQM